MISKGMGIFSEYSVWYTYEGKVQCLVWFDESKVITNTWYHREWQCLVNIVCGIPMKVKFSVQYGLMKLTGLQIHDITGSGNV